MKVRTPFVKLKHKRTFTLSVFLRKELRDYLYSKSQNWHYSSEVVEPLLETALDKIESVISPRSSSPMKSRNTSFSIKTRLLERIERLIDQNIIASRSEIVHWAVMMGMFQDFEQQAKSTRQEISPNQVQVGDHVYTIKTAGLGYDAN